MNILSWDIANYREAKRFFGNIEKSPIPFCITHKAFQDMLNTIGTKEPETGAKAFGPIDFLGIDTIEFDPASKNSLGSVVYEPDVKWGNKIVDYYLNRKGDKAKLWTADIHSHPGRFGRPSSKAGVGLGDLGYVEEVFNQNETMEYFFIPILTGTGSENIKIWSWVCKRESLSFKLYYADLKICDEKYFPERTFNPAWLKKIEKKDEKIDEKYYNDLNNTRNSEKIDEKYYNDLNNTRNSEKIEKKDEKYSKKDYLNNTRNGEKELNRRQGFSRTYL